MIQNGLWVVAAFFVPYAFVRHFFLPYILFRGAVPSSIFAQRLFAITVALCFHSHFILLLDVLDVVIREPLVRFYLLEAQMAILLTLSVFVYPTVMFFHMTRTLIKWRITATITAELLFLLGAWSIGLLFPTITKKGRCQQSGRSKRRLLTHDCC